ncbi:MAG: TlpA family protein disulfide reductase [Rhizobacter sp.]|nr:TlpA family protein disulfide reductase [Chlorobiales bacterium]
MLFASACNSKKIPPPVEPAQLAIEVPVVKALVAVTPVEDVDDTNRSGEAANFSWEDTDGNTKQLTDFNGKVRLVNFWATWCGTCNDDLPDLVAYQAAHERDLQIISISLDDEPQERIEKFVGEKQLNYPVIIDDEQELSAAYGNIRVVPTSFVVGRDGKIVARLEGGLDKKFFAEKIEPLLEKK